VALFSIERFIVVVYPLKKYLITGKRKHQKAILYITLFSLVLYSFSLKTSGLESNANEISCVTLVYWFKFANVFAFIDGFLTMFLPLCIIFISNVTICMKLLKSTPKSSKQAQTSQSSATKHKLKVSFRKIPTKVEITGVTSENISVGSMIIKPTKRKNLMLSPNQNSFREGSLNIIESQKSYSINLETPQPIHSTRRSLLRKSDEIKRKTKYHKTTRLLFIVSVSFFLLNTPMYLCKLYYYLRQFNHYSVEASDNEYVTLNNTHFERFNLSHNASTQILFDELDANTLEEIMERITCFLYYLNFSLNFFLYSFCAKDFRHNILTFFIDLYAKCFNCKIFSNDQTLNSNKNSLKLNNQSLVAKKGRNIKF